MKTADFDYDLPPEYIAQTPVEPRDAARLLVLSRTHGTVEHAIFREIGHYLQPGDVLVLNETRVLPARLYARKLPGGGRVELLLLRQEDEHTWEVMVGGKGVQPGRRLDVIGGPHAEVLADLGGPRRTIRFAEPLEPYLHSAGHVPLPPYIHRELQDPERYQTVYARQAGSAAAPTAGLHFTPELLAELQGQGVCLAQVTLHVGLDTFAPVTEEDPRQHAIHSEWCQITAHNAEIINQARRAGGRVFAVGTTSVRTLETAARHAAPGQVVGAFEGPTGLFILPGYDFRVVDGMITNFHLPKTTLLMLVSAFAGWERVRTTYELARRSGYRFYSFGDAMLIV